LESALKRIAYVAFLAICGLIARREAVAQAPLPIYDDTTANLLGFQDWSWVSGVNNFYNTSPIRSGAQYSISVSSAAAGNALWLYAPSFSTALYSNLTFWIHGGAEGGQVVTVFGVAGDANVGTGVTLPSLAADTWRQMVVPLQALQVDNVTNCNGFCWQLTGGASSDFYVDPVQLGPTPAPTNTLITVSAGTTVRIADARWFGVNAACWDGYFGAPETGSELAEAGLQTLRFPGGSEADIYNWTNNSFQYTGLVGGGQVIYGESAGNTTFDDFAQVATNLAAQAFITVNYGTGSPEEAAAWVKYSNKTRDYAFKFWEIGNEVYGKSWELDQRASPNDPYTYATQVQLYMQQMKAVDPTIKVGVCVTDGEDNWANYPGQNGAVNSADGTTHYGWTPVVLYTLKQLGVTPDFVTYHYYPEQGSDNDPMVLQGTGNWSAIAANLRQMITDYFGPGGANIELLCGENNSDVYGQGQQSVSLVNACYYADSLGQLMQTEFNSFLWWDLRNGQNPVGGGGEFDPLLYGWRQYGDLGMMNGLGDNLNDRYPQFFSAKLMQHFIRGGDSVVKAVSNNGLLSAYAAKRSDGSLALLVVNKDSLSNFWAQIQLTGYTPGSIGAVYSYGISQDAAARTGVGSCDIATNQLLGAAAAFSKGFAPYSITVIVLQAAPAITSIPASGVIGSPITITGACFSGATLVTFNGVPAAFTVNSGSQITATVPAGAASGPITVTTPSGTATSAATFTVLGGGPPTYQLGFATRVEGPGAGSDSVVLGASSPGAPWLATASVPWLHLGAGSQSGAGSASVVFSYDANTGGARTGVITITNQTLTITQAGSDYVAAPQGLTALASSGLNDPSGLAVDGAGNVYTTAQGIIYEWMAADNTVTTALNLVNEMVYPVCVAVDGAGNLYFGDLGGQSFDKWTAASNTVSYLSFFVGSVRSVALDAAGNAYFTSGAGGILEWRAATDSLTTLVASGLAEPTAVAVDVAGNVYIADTGNAAIKKWTAANNTVTTLVGSGLVSPTGVAVDGAGNVYIADQNRAAVYEWVAASNAVTTLVGSGLNVPTDVAVDGAGNVYITDSGSQTVWELPRAFVSATPKSEGAAAGSDVLPTVLPAAENLLAPFAPASDQTWLRINGATNGVVNFSFDASASNRTAHVTLLGASIAITQSGQVSAPTLVPGATKLAGGVLQFAFASPNQAAPLTLLTSTNVALPLADWTVAGALTNNGQGLFQFSAPITNGPRRFFTVPAQ
jgi:sugar lactone lactonase YvrE